MLIRAAAQALLGPLAVSGVMVVTSGNPTFEGDKARGTLLSSLRAIEKRLNDAAVVRLRLQK